MPVRNMNPLPGKMPNGQDQEEYTKRCHKFIDEYYTQLKKVARCLTRDQDYAEDLLQETLRIFLEGWHNINFEKTGYSNAIFVMRSLKSRTRLKRKTLDANLLFADPALLEYFSHKEERESIYSFLSQDFDRLTIDLTPEEKRHLEWYLDGLTYAEMQQYNHVTLKRIGQILTVARKKIKKQAQVLLQVET